MKRTSVATIRRWWEERRGASPVIARGSLQRGESTEGRLATSQGAGRPSQRVPGASPSSSPLWVRAVFALQRRKYGTVLEPTRVWARAPRPMRAFLELAAAVDRRSSPIPPDLRSLVMVKVSQVNSCSFCVDLNGAKSCERGAPPEKVDALESYRASGLFSPKERAALDYAVAMTRSDGGIDDRTFSQLREFFDDDAIVELTALVALQDASSKFNAALAIPAQGLCPVRAASAIS